jgi:hypothetical protein
MTPSTLVRGGCANLSLLCLVVLAISRATLADSILAFAPVTALAGLEGLNARQLSGACPASTQTACPDGIGCCPRGAACTYSRDVPVCDESCNGGPNCPNGGCCQVGYVCGTTNNFCSPAATQIRAPAATPANADNKKEVVEHEHEQGGSIVVVTPTTPAAPLHAEPTPSDEDPSIVSEETMSPGSNIGSFHLPTPTKTKTPTVPSSHSVATATSTTSRETTKGGAGGTKYVAGTTATNAPSQSAQKTSTGAASSIEVGHSLIAVIVGWIAGLAVML